MLKRKQISVGKSNVQGFGVFADQDIEPGELIEECYIICLGKKLEGNILNYVFCPTLSRSNPNDTHEDKDKVIPLGFGAIYNHADEPNAQYRFDDKEPIMYLTAKSPIKRGDEIFISYGSAWFEYRKIKPNQNRLWFRIKNAFQRLCTG